MADTHPTILRQFTEGLEALFPEVETTVERGGKNSGVWWIDIAAPSMHITAQWSQDIGFRMEAVEDDDADAVGYGSPPAEHYRSVELALARMSQLLTDAADLQQGSAAIRELRELHGVSQAELGTRLGIKQAAVSRVERRSDLHLDTLAAIITALGGTLDIRARFPDCEVPLRFAKT